MEKEGKRRNNYKKKYSGSYWKPKEKMNGRTNKEEQGKQARQIKFGEIALNFIKKEIFLAGSWKH